MTSHAAPAAGAAWQATEQVRMNFLRSHWKKLLVVGALLGALAAFSVWWFMFRVDPEFTKRDQANIEQNRKLDEALGGADDDDFSDFDEPAKGASKP